DPGGNLMRFGAGAEFCLAPGVPTYDNGVIELDEPSGPTVLGDIYGGVFSHSPHTHGGSGGGRGGADENFLVVHTPVPAPALGVTVPAICICLRRLRRRAA